ncbi:hypothetical protein A1OQ_21840 [Enterovibrio norvegicus FF-162]|uniref:DUF4426 domain-containing protein n=1 Tax=Photobacterium sanguinicancri TaxID=875932 RepID=A0ABX4FR80_9GAMM|nr:MULTISPECIES: hypothetical protein [Vibrionaceae]OEE78176.1 hypothetical protein A1OQ_21840 [Enterovibrio norvegicus FF-162]OZS41355.1 hypothetical protein ASV53_24195 [Photobacterium sanguinicancri]OZS41422.1 hypothetical protein ASV53_23805 [Photobacterium sanguinicancri]
METNTIISLSSVIIALSALGITIYQAYLGRKHNKLSLRPHLHYWFDNSELDNVYSFEVINNGIGPAKVKTFEVTLNGETVEERGTRQLSTALYTVFSGYELELTTSYLDKGNCISPNKSIELFKISFSNDTPISEREYKEKLNQISVVITYESFYKEIFKLAP